jgi:predicted RND superfamily exporter protein
MELDLIVNFLLMKKTDIDDMILISLSPLLQIVPFLALGLGVDDLFLMTNTYAEQEGSHSQYPPDVSVIQP